MKKTMIKTAIAILALGALTACGTAQGVASDAWGATKFVARTVTSD